MMVGMSLRIKDLENQLSQNSHNSHRPPSSDGYRKKPALGGNPKGPRGGKPGHSGNTFKMVDTVDHRQPIYLEQCNCGAPLKGEDMVLHTGRQVFDLPQPRLEVTDYQSFSCRCPRCDKQVVGRFPEGVNAPTQYGSRVRALTNLLYAGHHLSHQSIRELFCQLVRKVVLRHFW